MHTAYELVGGYLADDVLGDKWRRWLLMRLRYARGAIVDIDRSAVLNQHSRRPSDQCWLRLSPVAALASSAGRTTSAKTWSRSRTIPYIVPIRGRSWFRRKRCKTSTDTNRTVRASTRTTRSADADRLAELLDDVDRADARRDREAIGYELWKRGWRGGGPRLSILTNGRHSFNNIGEIRHQSRSSRVCEEWRSTKVGADHAYPTWPTPARNINCAHCRICPHIELSAVFALPAVI